MKISNKTKRTWIASETARGIKVNLIVRGEKHHLGSDLFFDTIDSVKECCKGEIVFTKRKITTTKSTIISK